MMKKYKIVFNLLLVFMATMVACKGDNDLIKPEYMPPYQNSEQVEWAQKIKEQLESLENKDTLALSEVADFEWDKLYIFSENLSATAINTELGFNWISDENFYVDELVDILVLLKITKSKTISL
ncbi:MAG: hypothetical protein IPN29_02350 [Saprospiraceae bacterium]|nr:hypothetical protein [Saprospiraceae bacterium]